MPNKKPKAQKKKAQKQPGRRPMVTTTSPLIGPLTARQAGYRVAVTNPRMPSQKLPTGVLSGPAKKTHHAAVCSLTDPFCAHSVGARVPDGSAALTIPYRAIDFYTATVGGTAGTVFAMVFAPDARGSAYTVSASTTVGIWNVNGNSFTALGNAATFFTNYVAESRLTSAGIRWIPTFPSTVAAPQIYVTELSNPATLLSMGSAGTAPDFTHGTNLRSMDSRSEFCCIARRQDKSADLFQSVAANASTGGWGGILILLVGTTGTTYGTFEMIENWEATLNLNSSTNAVVNTLATRPPPENKLVLSAVQKASQQIDTVIQGNVSAASAYVAKTASSALDEIISSGMALLGL